MKRIVGLLLCFVVLLSGCTTAAEQGHVVIYGQSANGTFLVPRVEQTSLALEVIQTLHTKLHEGKLFTYGHAIDVASGGNTTILITTPPAAIGTTHIVFDITTEAEASFFLYENPITTNNGSGLTFFDRNRSTNSTSDVLLSGPPTLTSLGTLIYDEHWGSGKGVGGDVLSFEEWQLAEGAMYLAVIHNETSSNNQISIQLYFYVD